MQKKRVQLPLNTLQATMQSQLDAAVSRADLRRSETMMGNCYEQAASIATLDKEVAFLKCEVHESLQAVLKSADDEACSKLLSTYGEFSI